MAFLQPTLKVYIEFRDKQQEKGKIHKIYGKIDISQ